MKRKTLILTLLAFACAMPLAHSRQEKRITRLAPLAQAERQALVAAISSGNGIAPGEKPVASEGPCDAYLKDLPGFQAGSLEVPEDWDHPESSPKIRVFYYWRGAKPGYEDRTPVVFFNGGPSAPSHNSAKLLAPQPFSSAQPFVFIDQRGTGCSTPYPEGSDAATAARLTHWGSRGIVGDSEAVRRQLFGERPWRVFGQSFGGLIVHRYLEIAPGGVERGISHGATVMSDPVQWTMNRVLSQKRVAEDYFAQYPDDRAILLKARAGIPASLCWSQNGATLCGPAVLDSLNILLGFQSSWYDLHLWIGTLLAEEKGAVNKDSLDQIAQYFVFGVYEGGGMGMAVISYVDLTPGFTDQQSCTAVLQRLQEAGQSPESFAINECRLLAAVERVDEPLVRALKGSPVSLEALLGTLQKGKPEFYLFSSGKDVFSPVELFAEEVAKLGPLAHYRSFPGSGHEGFHTEPEVLAAVTGETKQKK